MTNTEPVAVVESIGPEAGKRFAQPRLLWYVDFPNMAAMIKPGDKLYTHPDPAELDEMRARKDAAYEERNRCVALVARMAVAMGLRVAVTKTAIEGWSEDWHGCIYIDLPTGQVSWHFHDSQAVLFAGLPTGDATWDGHDTPEKYRRVETAFAA